MSSSAEWANKFRDLLAEAVEDGCIFDFSNHCCGCSERMELSLYKHGDSDEHLVGDAG